MAIADTRTELNRKLDESTDLFSTGSGINTPETQSTIKEILKGGTPDWYSHPEDYKAMAQESYLQSKDNADNLVNEYKFPNQHRFTDPARMVNRMTLKDFQSKLRNNGLTCWIDAQGRMQELFSPNGNVYGEGTTTVKIPLRSGPEAAPTFYNMHGDWFAWSCCGLAFCLGALSIRRLPSVVD